MGFSLKPLHLSPSREAGAPAAEARAFVWWQWRCFEYQQERKGEGAQATKKGQERLNARDSTKDQKSAMIKQLPWKIIFRTDPAWELVRPAWGMLVEQEVPVMVNKKRLNRILLQEFPGHFPYDFTETSGWNGVLEWHPGRATVVIFPPSLPTFKRRIRRRAKRVLTSKSFLQRAEKDKCVEA